MLFLLLEVADTLAAHVLSLNHLIPFILFGKNHCFWNVKGLLSKSCKQPLNRTVQKSVLSFQFQNHSHWERFVMAAKGQSFLPSAAAVKKNFISAER